MSLFGKNKKGTGTAIDELVTAKGQITQETEPVTGIYGEDEIPVINERYRRAAAAVGILKFIALFSFFIYFIVMTLVYSSEINTENFRYIVKDMNITIPGSAEEYKDIYYPADQAQSFALYRGDFVSVGRSGLNVINMNGKTVQSAELGYVSPRLETSGKYMLVYDLSNPGYSVYNSFSRLTSGDSGYPVSDAAMNDNGYYMIVTRDAEYKTVVCVYNGDSELVYKYRTNDKYIFDVIFENDQTFTLFTVSAKNGGYLSQILEGDIGNDGLSVIYEAENTVFLSAEATGENGFSVLCADEIKFFENGTPVSEYGFYGKSCRKFTAGTGYTAIVLSSADAGADSELIVFDESGNKLYSAPAALGIRNIYIYNGNIYQLYSDKIVRTDIKTESSYVYKTDGGTDDIVFVSAEVIFAASSGKAHPVSVYDDFKEE